VPAVSVVVPTYRRPELLRRCLESLRDQDVPEGTLEVLVVDDASGDETASVLRDAARWLPGLRWASQERNAGPAAARNRAVAMGGAGTLLFLDDDIVATPSLVGAHLRRLDRLGDQAGVIGLVEWHPDLEVTAFMAWLDVTDLQFAFRTWLKPGPVPSPESAFYTCNLSMSRVAFERAGGFDEAFPHPAYEDVELGWRLGQQGFSLWYSPEALAFHARSVDLATFCHRTAFVAESAGLLRTIRPEVPLSLTSPRDGLGQAFLRRTLRLVSGVRPRLLGRDLRSRYYWTEVEHAIALGLRRAGIQPGQPLP
jgi:GT2 family glycosyltransferase